MKVALVARPYESPEIGVSCSVRELARGVARAGGRVEVFGDVSEATRASAANDGFVLHRFWPEGGTDYAASHAMWSHMRRQGSAYDLVHVHGYLRLPAVAAARGLFGRLVFSPGNDDVPRNRVGALTRTPYRQLGRTALASADLVICSSHTEAADIGRFIPTVAARVKIVSSGIDADAIAGARPFSSERRVILSAGLPDVRGRADRVISALPDLGPGYELVVVGCGGARRRLVARARDLLVSEQVRFVDGVSDAVFHRWLHTAAVVVALTDADTSGVAMMEAACAGVPVIASETPTHREVAQLIDDAAVRLLPSRASPLLIADEIARAAKMRMSPLATLAVPSLKDVANQTVSLYSALLDGRLHSDASTDTPAEPKARDADQRDSQALEGTR